MEWIKPEQLIKNLRKSDEYIETIFMQGSCYKFHLFLKSIYPNAIPYLHLDGDHIVSRIGNNYYDIKGRLKKEHDFLYEVLNEDNIEEVVKWSFAKNNCLKLTECQFCEEPIVI